MKRLVPAVILVVLALGGVSAARGQEFEISAAPHGSLPVGSGSGNYRFAAGVSLSGAYLSYPDVFFAPSAEIGYSAVPLDADATLSLVRLGIGVQLNYLISDRLAPLGFVNAGGFFGTLDGPNATTGYGLAYRAGAGVRYAASDSLLVTGGVAFESYPGLHSAVGLYLGAIYRVGPGTARETRPGTTPGPLPADEGALDAGALRILRVDIDRIFPVLFKYYDENPLGTITIGNPGRQTISDIEVRLDAERVLDRPKLSATIPELRGGESAEVELYALFNDSLLEYTEGTRIAASIELSYRIGSSEHAATATVTLGTYDRNALTWDDDRKIAAFVTSRDDEIQRLGKNAAAVSRRHAIGAVNQKLQLAMAQLALLQAHGLTYVVDPTSAYAALSANASAVDYVQFPRQTLEYRAGDCDDLSAVYAALLESVGVRTAFITIPGHLFLAFALDVSGEEARRSVGGDVIVRDDGAWVPIEVTILDRGFLEAWATGARQWREHEASGSAGFYPTSQAWTLFEPVAFGNPSARVPSPDPSLVEQTFRAELDRFVSRQIRQEERELQARLDARPNDHRIRNRLGILYARYGRLDLARSQFLQIVVRREHVPALVNLGNLSFLSEDFMEARAYYLRALGRDPGNASAVLGIARVAHRLEEYDEVERRYRDLRDLNPELAERFSHLDGDGNVDGRSRASDAAEPGRAVVWEEDE